MDGICCPPRSNKRNLRKLGECVRPPGVTSLWTSGRAAARLRTMEEQMTLAVPLAHFAPRGYHDMWAIIAVGDAGCGQ